MGKQRLLEQAQELFFSIWRNFKFLVVFHGHVAAFAFGLPWRNSGRLFWILFFYGVMIMPFPQLFTST